MPSINLRPKDFLRWAIFGGALFFLAQAVRRHWAEVAQIRIEGAGWRLLAIALLITLIAHLWTGWVWGWILGDLAQPVPALWATRTYLKTNIAKYLPGNVWHLYGRVVASQKRGISLGAATLSVLLEPLLMAAAALMLGLVGIRQANWSVQALSLVIVLAGVHPRVLNPVLSVLRRLKGRGKKTADAAADLADSAPSSAPSSVPSEAKPWQLKRYPLRPLLGELLFVALRGLGFVAIALALQPVAPAQWLPLISGFSFAWLLGLVIPGAPGGIGVFEATAIALLGNQLAPAILLSVVALYRLISTLAEAIGAALAWRELGVQRPH
ncbi:UPF0104 family protein [Thermoleptolyngbya sichuanensis A183]|uniref:UPF0104 family protein n=1 Tax=Thermoleptolyngbya sichuanensis A183 TaxID=2737172 RepID=A0A6M8BHH5_9CYAN|nr:MULTISPECIES: lysylphosphatidylglycerol synthase domain-containing protein [Thermoleptolyngbya]MDG2614622.1 lysylphosphatidylglycerol synthase domain-containing protein [Thermoleptolyngbya sichuanensis XZ-Cy5]QKD84307.1 UPF0104 family protein [Thermoleptolyngbya sichuanensis A183]